MGINLRLMYGIAFALGIAVTAIAGVLIATYRPFDPYVGHSFIVLMFAAVVLGGMGSIPGALLGGLIIGLVQQLSTLVLPIAMQNVAIYGIFILMLYLRPQGILGKRGRIV